MNKIDLSSLNNTEHHFDTVNASLGDLIRVTLRETPTSGFRWSFNGASTDPDSAIQIVQDHFTPPPKGVIGGNGLRELTFKVNKVGTNVIALQNGRAWEPDKTAQIEITIQVPFTPKPAV